MNTLYTYATAKGMFLRALAAKDEMTDDAKFEICQSFLRDHFVNDRSFESYRRGIYKLFLKEIGFKGTPPQGHPYHVSSDALYSHSTLTNGYTIK
jgi:hypothetical protein